jgi:coenzyme F420-reducing hydrogenase gamma subunit
MEIPDDHARDQGLKIEEIDQRIKVDFWLANVRRTFDYSVQTKFERFCLGTFTCKASCHSVRIFVFVRKITKIPSE